MAELDFVYNTGAVWSDLLGTLRYPHTEDPLERLDTPDRLAEWLDAVGLAPAQRPLEADLRLARSVRDALRVLSASLLGIPAPPGAPSAEEAARVLGALGPADPAFDGSTASVRLQAPADTRSALARIVVTAVTDLGHHAHDFGQCSDPGCRKIYLDPSHVRKACCDTCSTRLRVRAYRERTKKA
ncbi:ABATE domain-containing protein [Leifsonia sp. NPDC080035]|uniref:ABATE domain-containing protein n=1 Tax=Leifsonia sp. NPDC080035 TaxID=3143936 RepID=A0AAU7GAK4_9MICO